MSVNRVSKEKIITQSELRNTGMTLRAKVNGLALRSLSFNELFSLAKEIKNSFILPYIEFQGLRNGEYADATRFFKELCDNLETMVALMVLKDSESNRTRNAVKFLVKTFPPKPEYLGLLLAINLDDETRLLARDQMRFKLSGITRLTPDVIEEIRGVGGFLSKSDPLPLLSPTEAKALSRPLRGDRDTLVNLAFMGMSAIGYSFGIGDHPTPYKNGALRRLEGRCLDFLFSARQEEKPEEFRALCEELRQFPRERIYVDAFTQGFTESYNALREPAEQVPSPRFVEPVLFASCNQFFLGGQYACTNIAIEILRMLSENRDDFDAALFQGIEANNTRFGGRMVHLYEAQEDFFELAHYSDHYGRPRVTPNAARSFKVLLERRFGSADAIFMHKSNETLLIYKRADDHYQVADSHGFKGRYGKDEAYIANFNSLDEVAEFLAERSGYINEGGFVSIIKTMASMLSGEAELTENAKAIISKMAPDALKDKSFDTFFLNTTLRSKKLMWYEALYEFLMDTPDPNEMALYPVKLK